MASYVGIDGGATKTHVVVVDDGGDVLGEGTSGASNYQTVGVAQAQRNIVEALNAALAQAGRSVDEVDCVAGGFAGLDTIADVAAVQEVLAGARRQAGGEAPWLAVNDAVVAWAGALAGRPGAIMVAGTGAIALAVNQDGRCVRADGWGHWGGDEGSAFHIGRQGVRAALRWADQRGPETSLLAALDVYARRQEQAGWEAWIAAVNSDCEMAHGQIAGFAPEVVAVASGDRVAREILCDAGEQLARTTWSALQRADLSDQSVLVATVGSVLTRAAFVRKQFGRALQRLCPNCGLQWPLLPPAQGAALLAKDRALIPQEALCVRCEA